jgi:hypothetical protein
MVAHTNTTERLKTIDIKVVFHRMEVRNFSTDGKLLYTSYCYPQDLDDLVLDETKILKGGKLKPLAQRFSNLLGIDGLLESYKGIQVHLHIPIARRTYRYPWNLLRLLHKNILVIPVYDFETFRPETIAPGEIKFLIIANINYFVTDESLLAFEEELHSIRSRLESFGNAVRLKILYTPDINELTGTLASEQFHIVHYIGHSDFVPRDDRVYFQFLNGSPGSVARIDLKAFAALLENQRQLKLLFFNSCTSGYPTADFQNSAASIALIKTGTAVVAMRYPVRDSTGRSTGNFYDRYFRSGLKNALKELIDDLSEFQKDLYVTPTLHLPHRGTFSVKASGGGIGEHTSSEVKDRNFIGRERELNELLRLFIVNRSVNIYGPAKIGKTSLILTFLDRHRLKFRERSIIQDNNNGNVYTFNFHGSKKIIVESRLKFETCRELDGLKGNEPLKHLQLGDLSESEAALAILLNWGINLEKMVVNQELNRRHMLKLLGNPYLIKNGNDENIMALIDDVYGAEVGKQFTTEELSMIHLLLLAPFPLDLKDFHLLSNTILFPHGKNYPDILQQYIKKNWIAVVENRLHPYSHVFLGLNENNFNNLDRNIMERNAMALVHLIQLHKNKYSNTEKEHLSSRLVEQEFILEKMIGNEERMVGVYTELILSQAETCKNKTNELDRVNHIINSHHLENFNHQQKEFFKTLIMANLHNHWSNREKAIIHYKEAIEYFERLGMIENAGGYFKYAELLYSLGNLQNALRDKIYYCERSLHYFKKSGDRQRIEIAENNLKHWKKNLGV